MLQAIDLQLNYPLLTYQETEFKEIIQASLNEVSSFLSVTPTGGRIIDREVGAHWLSQPNYPVSVDDVYIGSGGHHSCLVALMAANLQNKTIVVEELTYSNFRSIATLLNIKLIPCALDDFGIVPPALAEICAKHKPAALFITPTVHNPLGYVSPVDRRHQIVSIARANNLIILEDDAYGFLEDTPVPNFFHLAPELSFYVYSFSKPLAQSIKTSYLLAPKQFSAKVIEASRATASNNSLLLMDVLNEYIASGRLEILIKEKRAEGQRRQTQARQLLGHYQVAGHTNSFHLWLVLPNKVKADMLNTSLIEAGVKIVPSSAYSIAENVNNQAIRIALGGERDFDKVINGIEIIKKQINILLTQ
jgi:DNA-binding transcriptional MocR family regulator